MSTENNRDIKHIGQLKLGDRVGFNSDEWELTDFREDAHGNVQIVFTRLRNIKRQGSN